FLRAIVSEASVYLLLKGRDLIASPYNGVVRALLAAAATACAVPYLLAPWSPHATTRSSNIPRQTRRSGNLKSSCLLRWPQPNHDPHSICKTDAHGSHSALDR